MLFFRIYQILIAVPLLLVATLLAAITTAVMCIPTRGRFWGYYPAKLWGRVFCILNFVRVTVDGRANIDPLTSYVFVANHQGAFDIFSIYGYLGHNFKWMMKASLRRIPFVGYACYKAGHIFVDRSNAQSIRLSMEKARRQLSDGMSLVVFPEGSRSRDGRLGVFKRGAFMLASELSLPVVPITISGAYEIMPRSARLPRPGRIRLTIHRPIEPQAADPADTGSHNRAIQAVSEQARRAIASSLPQ